MEVEKEKCTKCGKDLDARAMDSGEEEIEEIRFYGEFPILMGWIPQKRMLTFEGVEEFSLTQCGKILLVGAINHRHTMKRCFSQASLLDICTGELSHQVESRFREKNFLLTLDKNQPHPHWRSYTKPLLLVLDTKNSRANYEIMTSLTPSVVMEMGLEERVQAAYEHQDRVENLKEWGVVSETEMMIRFREEIVNVPQLLRRKQWTFTIQNESVPPVNTSGKTSHTYIQNRSFQSNTFRVNGKTEEIKPYVKLVVDMKKFI